MPREIEIILGDITRQKIQVIVNAAAPDLLGGGGVDGAIHQAAGPELLEECRAIGGCPTGEARITEGYRLHAEYVIHTVGPVWTGGSSDEDRLLESAYWSSIKLAAENGLAEIAFPSISTGAYGFPVDRAARIAIRTLYRFWDQHEEYQLIRIVCFDEVTLSAFESAHSEHLEK